MISSSSLYKTLNLVHDCSRITLKQSTFSSREVPFKISSTLCYHSPVSKADSFQSFKIHLLWQQELLEKNRNKWEITGTFTGACQPGTKEFAFYILGYYAPRWMPLASRISRTRIQLVHVYSLQFSQMTMGQIDLKRFPQVAKEFYRGIFY